ncbi:TetR/AcrR family transcriptional regulator [Shinella yambaruensis]|uniref:TetR family transcriptional regulator n=1 Tax=Shinella yambaruensis TaxID=415996 RepID=A0ABQ5ZTF7_9HYPH|nr:MULTISPECIES: TetR/AcrR family transcriptional regulator [Shinella]CAI0337822.1 TetR family transcriptional regulator [Rhizobiaceae bacterium]CAK7256297.1 TetR family transcriptional regulator [Shinella sp. WSC3-e]MCJ8023865.1 TetR/AcrR family transcriptional regulator [Shinella yambaruensis]MCO5138230.1 TetR/AcrR family transcriptional regulator [Shinella sp.]MCU7978985.1 TetR/AcrR family transcriptional regulator [Shinella yambaruensis]
MRKPREEMIAETRAKLIAAGRQAFGTVGYAAASMDDFTAGAGLTRGALYHHFGDKKGLLQAVIQQIDAEMTLRLNRISAAAPDRWQGFVAECVAYIEMALEPEIQRIMFRDGPAVLGDVSQWPTNNGCIAALSRSIEQLKADGVMGDIDTEAAARLINGASSHAALWIAKSDDPEETSRRAVKGFRTLLEGLRVKG